MSKGAPSPPDPYKTADAQSQANTQAAYQNFGLQNVNQYTPYGNQTYNQSGWYQFTDPTTGKTTNAPRFESHATLSPGEQKILDLNTVMRTNMGQLAVDQSQRAQQLLSTTASTDDLKTQWANGPQAAKLQTTFGGNNPLQMSLGSGGKIATGWGDTGSVQGSVGAQNFRQDQSATDRAAIEQAMMERYQRQAAPRNEAQEADMANRGLSPGGQGYSTMKDAQNREFTEANTSAYLASGQESRAAQEAYNAASQAKLGQDVTRGTFANQAQQQVDDQAARRAGFQNAAQLQKFNELKAQGMFANEAQETAYKQALGRAEFSNAANTSMFTMGGQEADRQNALRQAEWTEALSSRNQQYNEMAALAGLSQVNTPSFQPFQGSQTQAAPIGQYIYDDFNIRSQQASNDMSGIFGIAGNIAGMLPWGNMLGFGGK